MKKLVIDCSTGEQTLVDLTQEEIDQQIIDEKNTQNETPSL